MRDAEPLDEPAEGPIVAAEGEAFFVAVLDDDKRRRRIEAILSGLPEAYALALQWRYWEKRPAREMAEMTGKTEKAVERLLARALIRRAPQASAPPQGSSRELIRG